MSERDKAVAGAGTSDGHALAAELLFPSRVWPWEPVVTAALRAAYPRLIATAAETEDGAAVRVMYEVPFDTPPTDEDRGALRQVILDAAVSAKVSGTGVEHASRNREYAAIHGNVRPQSGAREGEVPASERGEGV